MIAIRNRSRNFELWSNDEDDTWTGTHSSNFCQRKDFEILQGGCVSPVVKAPDNGRHVMGSTPVPFKTRRVGQRCTLNLSRAETSSHWCGVVVKRGGASSGVVHVT
ncbi:hypothetical protein TNCV_1530851 [Trichonephila clavipes]|nr:hypothetical protein TNCV_1530851 [Trichonephila clavipes]